MEEGNGVRKGVGEGSSATRYEYDANARTDATV